MKSVDIDLLIKLHNWMFGPITKPGEVKTLGLVGHVEIKPERELPKLKGLCGGLHEDVKK